MKKLTMSLFTIALTSAVIVSCNKKELNDFPVKSKNKSSNETNVADRVGSIGLGVYKDPDYTAGPGKPACKPGTTNCLEYCCVTPKTIQDFIDAIDGNQAGLENFLSTEGVIDELSNSDDFYVEALTLVKQGAYEIMYYELPGDGSRVAFIFAENEVSLENNEGSLILNRY